MAERRQKIRGTTLQLDQEIGLIGLLAYDTEKNNLRLYDGVVAGGYKILNEAQIATLYTLPTRLGTDGVNLNGLSANAALTNGWYYCSATTTDTPEVAAAAILVSTVPTTGGTVITQMWNRGSNGNRYQRQRSAAGVWTAWTRLVDLTSLTTDPVSKAYDANLLDGQDSTYYTAIAARLGYTPLNKAGDTITNNLTIGNALIVNGAVSLVGNVGMNGTLSVNGAAVVYGNQIAIQGTSPRLLLSQTDGPNFYLFADGQACYILTDRDDNGSWEDLNPFTLDNGGGIGYIYGQAIWTNATIGAADITSKLGFVPANQIRNLAAGGGLTGGGTLQIDRAFALGTPTSISNVGGANYVSGTTHSHALAFLAAEVYTGAGPNDLTLPVGTYIWCYGAGVKYALNAIVLPCLGDGFIYYHQGVAGAITRLAGTWRNRGHGTSYDFFLTQRVG